MKSHLSALLLVCLLPVALPPLALAQSAADAGWAHAAQTPDEVPDRRPEVKALVDRLEEARKARGEQEQAALDTIAEMLKTFEQSGPKDRESMAKAVGDCIPERRKELGPEQPDERLAVAAAVALGRMGVDGGKQLVKYVEHKNLREKPRARREVILALGQSRFDGGVKPLIDLLTNHEPAIQAAAAEALGHHGEAEQKVRKQIFKALLETIMPVKNAVDADAADNIERQRLDTISTPIIGSMKKLSKHEENDLQAWQRWWNHNKNNDWDRP